MIRFVREFLGQSRDQSSTQAIHNHTNLHGFQRYAQFHYKGIEQIVTKIPNPLTLNLLSPHISQSYFHSLSPLENSNTMGESSLTSLTSSTIADYINI